MFRIVDGVNADDHVRAFFDHGSFKAGICLVGIISLHCGVNSLVFVTDFFEGELPVCETFWVNLFTGDHGFEMRIQLSL
ncbi:hypothetical protein SDC9_128843 [bioreactor metagenome]|uniref:Uncharacterized protein n=1 Tax=bioreactor metagenome TaxID=1076179 RepID=A0A645CXD3_9ZZZZ